MDPILPQKLLPVLEAVVNIIYRESGSDPRKNNQKEKFTCSDLEMRFVYRVVRPSRCRRLDGNP